MTTTTTRTSRTVRRSTSLLLALAAALSLTVTTAPAADAAVSVIGGQGQGWSYERVARVTTVSTRADLGAIGLDVMNLTGHNVRVRAWVWSDALRQYRTSTDRWIGNVETISSPGLGDITLYPRSRGNHQVYVLVTDPWGNVLQRGWFSSYANLVWNGHYYSTYHLTRAVL